MTRCYCCSFSSRHCLFFVHPAKTPTFLFLTPSHCHLQLQVLILIASQPKSPPPTLPTIEECWCIPPCRPVAQVTAYIMRCYGRQKSSMIVTLSTYSQWIWYPKSMSGGASHECLEGQKTFRIPCTSSDIVNFVIIIWHFFLSSFSTHIPSNQFWLNIVIYEILYDLQECQWPRHSKNATFCE